MEKRIKVKDLLKCEPGQEVTAKGWVRTKRGNKNVAFIALNDGSTIYNIQVVVDKTAIDENVRAKVTTGACIRVSGKLVESVGSGQAVEIQAGESGTIWLSQFISSSMRKGSFTFTLHSSRPLTAKVPDRCSK